MTECGGGFPELQAPRRLLPGAWASARTEPLASFPAGGCGRTGLGGDSSGVCKPAAGRGW